MSNSDLKILPNPLVEPAANLKYSPIESLFFSRALVNDCAESLTVVKDAENCLVAFIELTRFLVS